MHFQYCPNCGARLKEKEIGDEGLVPYCDLCKTPWFDMFSTCIIALVVNENGEAALLRQGYISSQYYNLVSGYMKPGETAEITAQREIYEEIGIQVSSLEFAGTYWYGKKDMLMIGFLAKANRGDFVLSGEVEAAEWVAAEDAIRMVHPKGSVSYALLEKYLEKKSGGRL